MLHVEYFCVVRERRKKGEKKVKAFLSPCSLSVWSAFRVFDREGRLTVIKTIEKTVSKCGDGDGLGFMYILLKA